MAQNVISASATGKSALWTARVVGAFIALFLLSDAIGKFMRPQPVVDAFARLGMSISLAPVVGALLAILVLLYAVPRTRILGAMLLTGYLGGAVAIQLRASSPAFETVFPVITGVLVWLPLYLADRRVRALI
jgi:hypothetical protein